MEQGRQVTLFPGGDAVQCIRDAVLDNLVGLGSGRLRESYDALVAGGGRILLSPWSSAARGVTEADLAGKPAEMVLPTAIIGLALEHDRVFTF